MSNPCFAQTPKPYAAINHAAIDYNGPGRDAGNDLAGAEVFIGLLAPMTGLRQAEGEALQRSAQMAIDQENLRPLPSGRRFVLITRDESGPWGQASTQVVHLIFNDQAVAIITSAEGDSAHLAEQVGNKIGVPVLTLSTDSTTTEINLPWIFRLAPSDQVQARTFARDIYQTRKLRTVILLYQGDRDGRLGADEFAKTACEMHAPAPTRIEINPDKLPEASEFRGGQAAVVWTDTALANRLTARVRAAQPTAPIYLCHKAAEGDGNGESRPPCSTCGSGNAEPWIAAPPQSPAIRAEFDERYRHLFGAEPGMGAAEAYDAVRILAASLRQSGPNRARLRDALAGMTSFDGAAGMISFDHAGNNISQVTLLKFP